MTKKLFSVFVTIFIAASFSSCGSSENSVQESHTSQPEAVQQPETQEDNASEMSENAEIEPTDSYDDGGTAVFYFSATGTTAEIAQLIANETGADLFEIIPQVPYSSDDLNYNDDNCRANKEQNDDYARPGISGDLSAAEGYDVIYLGYPIWWGTAPRIIQTFIESYNLSGKTVYTFCTSGGSGIEKSVSDLQSMYKSVNIISGKRLNDADAEDIRAWIEDLS